MKKLVIYSVVLLSLSPVALADYILTSGMGTGANDGQSITRYTDDFTVVWERSPANSTAETYVWQVEISPLTGDVYTINYGGNQQGKHWSYADGSYVGRFIPLPNQTDGTGKYTAPSQGICDFQWGYDYNKDGVDDVWVARREVFEIYDGATLNRTGDNGVADLLASVSVADSTVQDGSGAFGLAFGPDVNGDGVGELFAMNGINANTGSRIVVWDPVTLAKIAAYNADGTKDNCPMILGPDFNADGKKDLWVADPRSSRLRVYDCFTGTLLAGSVSLVSASDGTTAVTPKFPTDIDLGPDGDLLVTTRFASSLDINWTGGAEIAGGDLLRVHWDPTIQKGLVSLLFENVKRLDGVAYVATNKNVAQDPSPANGATDVSRDTLLSWTASQNATAHDVYFGTSAANVEAADRTSPLGSLVSQDQAASTFDPGRLELGQTYYWRVDEVSADSTLFKGTVWTFTVEPVAYKLPAASITATASSVQNANMGPGKTVDGSGLNDAGQHGTTDTTMWLSAMGTAEPAWIQYQFDKIYSLYEMWVWNSNQAIEAAVGFGVKTAKVEYSADGVTWIELSNVPEFGQGTGNSDYAHNTTVAFGGVAARFVKITVLSGWGTLAEYGLSEVRFFYAPMSAQTPKPADSAAAVSLNTTLSWKAGRQAASHQLYLGTDANALPLAATVAGASYALADLNVGTKYYWRVDEVNAAEAISTWAGTVWNFTTTAFIVVDDMESYNDKVGTRVFDAWVDGWGTTSNGSQVGYTTAPFTENTTVHAGKQAMPFKYTNTGGMTSSEAKRTFSTAQDWTKSGVKTLTLFFYGNTTNTDAGLYVKINSTKIAYTGDVANASKAQWTQWDVDLSTVPASTLKSVSSLTIGSGSGSGTLFIDDIRLD